MSQRALRDDPRARRPSDQRPATIAKELPSNVAATGTDSHAQSNFSGSLRYGYEHDVHNADAANYERDGSH
jgi:hypothetical protein